MELATLNNSASYNFRMTTCLFICIPERKISLLSGVSMNLRLKGLFHSNYTGTRECLDIEAAAFVTDAELDLPMLSCEGCDRWR